MFVGSIREFIPGIFTPKRLCQTLVASCKECGADRAHVQSGQGGACGGFAEQSLPERMRLRLCSNLEKLF